MNIANWLRQFARSWPDRPAILDGMELFATYVRLAKREAALAAALSSKHGIEAGDRVAIFAPNWPAVARGDVEAPRRYATGRSSWRPSRNT